MRFLPFFFTTLLSSICFASIPNGKQFVLNDRIEVVSTEAGLFFYDNEIEAELVYTNGTNGKSNFRLSSETRKLGFNGSTNLNDLEGAASRWIVVAEGSGSNYCCSGDEGSYSAGDHHYGESTLVTGDHHYGESTLVTGDHHYGESTLVTGDHHYGESTLVTGDHHYSGDSAY